MEAQSHNKLMVRPLTPEEIQEFVAPIYEQTGNSLPHPNESVFLGVIEGGACLGFLCLQIRLHAEPLWISPGHSQIVTSLVSAAEKYILENSASQWVYLFAPAGRIGQLASSLGMQLEPWNVYSKLVQRETPQAVIELPALKTVGGIQ